MPVNPKTGTERVHSDEKTARPFELDHPEAGDGLGIRLATEAVT